MTNRGGSPGEARRPIDQLARARALRERLEYSDARAVARAAVRALQRGSVAEPQLAEAQLLLGRLEEDLGDLTAAEDAYAAAVDAAELAPIPTRHVVRAQSGAQRWRPPEAPLAGQTPTELGWGPPDGSGRRPACIGTDGMMTR